ncbi:MAG: hypothetical protein AB7V42_09055 [Thermoleophilia bacterium]
MHDYRVTFSAVSGTPLSQDATERLWEALTAIPGAEGVDDTGQDPGTDTITATFWIKVRLGMADAARDGSRLAKEALKVAGMGEAQLTELAVSLRPRPE